MTENMIDDLVANMSVEEQAYQVLCTRATEVDADGLGAHVEKYPVGGLFLAHIDAATCAAKTAAVRNAARIPVIFTMDLVNGAGSRIEGCTLFPWQMAMGAADSEELTEICAESTAREGRELGVHWTLAPVTDLDLNFRAASIYSRAFGDDPDHVARHSRAFVRGIQKDGLMAAAAKHFPGDGFDERDPHISSPINSLSREEWMASYGKVWKTVIDEGVLSIMPGHIALPFVDPGSGGPLPPPIATYSRPILTDFLRGELGFQGAIISDAMQMAGCCGTLPTHERVPAALAAGCDMVLFTYPEEDREAILRALKEKRLSEERLADAVRRVLTLKAKLGLFEEKERGGPVTPEEKQRYRDAVDRISERSVRIIRDIDGRIPLSLPAGAKVLTITLQPAGNVRGAIQNLNAVDEALRRRGFEVEHLDEPPAEETKKAMVGKDAVFLNIHMPPQYGTSRFGARMFNRIRDSFWPNHPASVITSFCDPFKIFEMNYAPNMVIAYSNNPEAQELAVRVWLGEANDSAKNPVRLEGYFEREV